MQYAPDWIRRLFLHPIPLVIALVLVLIASQIKPGRDLELAREVYRTAKEGLIADGRAIETEFASFKQAFRHPLDSVLPGLIVPLATMLIEIIQKKSEKPPMPKEWRRSGDARRAFIGIKPNFAGML